MDDTKGTNEAQANGEQPRTEVCLQGTCPYCLSEIDVHLDIKDRPYWRCWRCEVRLFGTKTAMKTLTADGWIWRETRPVEAVKAWLTRIVDKVRLKSKKEK
jgi:hypothetical protein